LVVLLFSFSLLVLVLLVTRGKDDVDREIKHFLKLLESLCDPPKLGDDEGKMGERLQGYKG
jgi:hypothetical protein